LGHQKKKMPPPLPLKIGPLAALAKVPASSQRSCKLTSSKWPGNSSDWLLTGLCLPRCSCCASCCLAACWHRVCGLRDARAFARRTGLHACGHHCALPAHTLTLCWGGLCWCAPRNWTRCCMPADGTCNTTVLYGYVGLTKAKFD